MKLKVMEKGIGTGRGLFSVVCLLLLCIACASVESGDGQPEVRMYTEPYDEVWAAMESLIIDDMHCVANKISKKKGIIETEWATRIDTDGTFRWKLKARADKKKDGVLVMIEKRVEMRDEMTRSMNRYRKAVSYTHLRAHET